MPGGVEVTGFYDFPVARHLHPQLSTVRQPITDLGATAFETLYSMITDIGRPRHDIILPTRVIRRESCGCPPQSYPGVTRRSPLAASGSPAHHAQGTTAPAQRQA